MEIGEFEEIDLQTNNPLDILNMILEMASASRRPADYIFRGESRIFPALIPSIGRVEKKEDLGINNYDLEESLFQEYIRKSAAVNKENSNKGLVNYLIEAQLHGLKTRLLDWSVNALVATYFVVSQNEDKDGYLWILQTGLFSDHNFGKVTYFDVSGRVAGSKELSSLPLNELFSIQDGLGLVAPPYAIARVVAQQSIFTFNADPKKNFCEYFSRNFHVPMSLRKLRIKSEFKKPLRKMLNDMNINKSTLFPDLDGLCSHLNWYFTEERHM